MRSLRNGFLAATAALACVAAAAPAAAQGAPLFSPVADDVASVRGDGDRWVAYVTRGGALRVFDERAGTAWNATIPCTPRRGEWDPPLIEVRGGFALVACVATTPRLTSKPVLLELATRRWHEVAGLDGLSVRYQWYYAVEIDGAGARWLPVTANARGMSDSLWLDWRTGATAQPTPTAGTVIDPDTAALQVTTSCATSAFTPERQVGPLAFGSSRGSFALRRCSPAGPPVQLEETPSSIRNAQLGGGAVTWSTWVDRLYLSRCGVRLTWATSHTNWLHSSRSLWRGDQAKGTLERAPLPSCADATGLFAGSGGRTVAPRAVTGAWPSLDGSEAELLGRPEQARPTLRVRAGGAAVSLRTAQPATAVRWRLAGGRWHAATSAGRSWRLAVSPPRRGSRPLTLAVTYDRSHVTRAELSVRAAR